MLKIQNHLPADPETIGQGLDYVILGTDPLKPVGQVSQG